MRLSANVLSLWGRRSCPPWALGPPMVMKIRSRKRGKIAGPTFAVQDLTAASAAVLGL